MTRVNSLWHRCFDSLDRKQSSYRLAAGVAMGMIIGLLPKESLLPVVFVIVLILSPANLLTGTISAIVFSWLSGFQGMTPVMQRIGVSVQQIDGVEFAINQWATTPLIPWFRLESPVVLGALVLGAGLFVPVFLVATKLIDLYRHRLKDRIQAWINKRSLMVSRKTNLHEGQA